MFGKSVRDAAQSVRFAATGTRDAADRIADAVEEGVRVLTVAVAAALMLYAIAVVFDD